MEGQQGQPVGQDIMHLTGDPTPLGLASTSDAQPLLRLCALGALLQ
jgi:hypothetical protein